MSARLYSVAGADRNSGQDVHVELRAHSMSHAEMLAINRGILISCILPIATPSAIWCGGRSLVLWIVLLSWSLAVGAWSALIHWVYAEDLALYHGVIAANGPINGAAYARQLGVDDMPSHVAVYGIVLPFFVWLPVALALFIAAVATWRRQAKL